MALPSVPSDYINLYHATWRLFADLTVKRSVSPCGCSSLLTKQQEGYYRDGAHFLAAANTHLNDGDIFNFEILLTAANTLFTSINPC